VCVCVGGENSYTHVLPDGFLLKAIVFTVCEHDYMNVHPPPPPPIIVSSYGPGHLSLAYAVDRTESSLGGGGRLGGRLHHLAWQLSSTLINFELVQMLTRVLARLTH
jgi:hypothetical protein